MAPPGCTPGFPRDGELTTDALVEVTETAGSGAQLGPAPHDRTNGAASSGPASGEDRDDHLRSPGSDCGDCWSRPPMCSP